MLFLVCSKKSVHKTKRSLGSDEVTRPDGFAHFVSHLLHNDCFLDFQKSDVHAGMSSSAIEGVTMSQVSLECGITLITTIQWSTEIGYILPSPSL